MTAASSRRRIPSWLPQVAGYGLSAGSLIWVLHGYPLNELLPTIRSLDWRWVALAVLTDLSVYVVHGWRWNTLLSPVARLGFWTTVQSIYIGLFANEVLPFRVGELIRCYLMAHWNNLRLSLAFASAAVERIIDGFWLLAAFVIATGFIKHLPHDQEAARFEEWLTLVAWIVAAIVLVVAVALCWIVLHKHHAHPVLRESRWAATLRHIVEGLQLMGTVRTIGLTLVISLLYLALQALFVFAVMKADLFDHSFWVAGAILTIVRLGTVVPNAPGNLGLGNFAVFIALRLFEVEANEARTFSLIFYAVQTFPLLIGGAIATALTGLNIGELRDRARQHMNGVHAE